MYIIAKYASAAAWKNYFLEDPTVTGLSQDFGVSQTYTGRKMSVSEVYEDYQEAEADCKRLNDTNPSGNYAVCPLISN